MNSKKKQSYCWGRPITIYVWSHFRRRIYIIKGVMFACLYLRSVWPAKRLGRSRLRPNLTHSLMSTQGVFLSRSMSRSFMYACGSDRLTKHPERCAKATPGERCSNYVRTTGEARRRRRRAASAEGASRTPSGGRVITARSLYFNKQQSKCCWVYNNSKVSKLITRKNSKINEVSWTGFLCGAENWTISKSHKKTKKEF